MPQLIVRNVSAETVRRLRVRAAANKRSGEEEHRRILEQALGSEPAYDFWAEADRLRAETRGKVTSNSTDFIAKSGTGGPTVNDRRQSRLCSWQPPLLIPFTTVPISRWRKI